MTYTDIVSIILAADDNALDIADTFLSVLDESAERYSVLASTYSVSK